MRKRQTEVSAVDRRSSALILRDCEGSTFDANQQLRHSFASRALALGESLSMIGKLLGHNKIETTSRYAHLARDSIKASSARVADSIGTDILDAPS